MSILKRCKPCVCISERRDTKKKRKHSDLFRLPQICKGPCGEQKGNAAGQIPFSQIWKIKSSVFFVSILKRCKPCVCISEGGIQKRRGSIATSLGFRKFARAPAASRKGMPQAKSLSFIHRRLKSSGFFCIHTETLQTLFASSYIAIHKFILSDIRFRLRLNKQKKFRH